MSIVERMARAICEDSGQSWESALESYREICTGFALAALRAMEEPTEEMVAKGVNRAAGFASAGNRMCNGYRAMINAAIQQAETEGARDA